VSTADEQAARKPATRGRWVSGARAHPVRAYFVITYLLSWCYWLIIYGLVHNDSELWAAPGAFVPALAAILVTQALEGRRGVHTFVRSWIRWRLAARWYAFALVVLPALVVLSYVFLPEGTKGFERSPVILGLTYLATFVVILFVGGGQEEPGWRGFALPRLQQRFGPVTGSVVLGTLWGFWHLPLFVLIPNYDNAGYGATAIATAFLVFVGGFTIGLSLLLAWLFNRTQGSVLLAMLAHASVNTALAFGPITRSATLISFLAILAIGIVVAIATRGRLGYQKELSV
jgi:membrane protease YdiL (CAAX protease family)